MPVGYQLNLVNINNTAGQLATVMRNVCRAAGDFHSAIDALGADDTGRQAALVNIGFTTGDAQQMVYLVNVLNTLAAIYYGNAVQTPAFDFDNALSALWGTNVQLGL